MKILKYLKDKRWAQQELDQMRYFQSQPLLVRFRAVEQLGEVASLLLTNRTVVSSASKLSVKNKQIRSIKATHS